MQAMGIKETNKQVLLQSLTLISSAFALVAALAWNEAIKALIERYVPTGSGLYSRFAYAIIVTAVVVIVSTRLSRLTQTIDPEAAEKNEKK